MKFRQFLEQVEIGKPKIVDGRQPHKATTQILREIYLENEDDEKFSTSHRKVGSLFTYHFLEKGEECAIINDFSKNFISEKTSYPDLILKCLSNNLEWSSFIPDVIDIIQKKDKKLTISGILTALEENEYDVENEATAKRYLSEIIPILDLARVIDYSDRQIKSGTRKKEEIKKIVFSQKRDLLRRLRLAYRRQYTLPQLRKFYQAAVKAYIPTQQSRNLIQKAQADIDEVMKVKIRDSGKVEKERTFTSKWKLSDELYEWQSEFAEKWMKRGEGIAKVVTGAGKTHLAMAIMERLKSENKEFHTTIIVPTIPLMYQWKDNIVKKLLVSPDEIGLRGGGRKDSFNGKNILITVINSAIKNDFISKETAGLENNLLVVDECHRSGAQKFRAIFAASRKWNLGLSATPEREADDYFESVIQTELGPILATYNYDNALKDDIIPPYNITNYAVLLENKEKVRYRKLTKDIENIIKRLKMKYRSIDRGGNFSAKLKKLQSKYPNDKDLFRYFQKTKERKMDLLYRAENRSKITCGMLNTVLGRKTTEKVNLGLKEEDRAIVFHENISEINDLYMSIDSPLVSIYHSQFPSSLNKIGLELYQRGTTRVLLSVKALVEGIDVPSTNLGVIMASSSSRVQRVQSLGRILRKAEGKDETNLVIVYVHNTTDERIYRNTNWDSLVGEGRVKFRQWSEFGELEIENPGVKFLRKMEQKDIVVNEDELVPGGDYPGRYDGQVLSFDSRGKLFTKKENSREYLDIETNGLWKLFRANKPTGGSFKINQNGHILVSTKNADGWKRNFLGYAKDCNLTNFVPLVKKKKEGRS